MLIWGVIGQKAVQANAKVYDNFAHVSAILDTYACDADQIVTGGGHGVEDLVARWAEDNKIALRKIPPNIAAAEGAIPAGQLNEQTKKEAWERAFLQRNSEVLEASQGLIVFWNGIVPHVLPLLTQAMRARKQAIVIPMV